MLAHAQPLAPSFGNRRHAHAYAEPPCPCLADTKTHAPCCAPFRCATNRYDDAFEVLHTAPIQNAVLIMNIKDINTRKTIIHAVNKNTLIKKELGGMEQPVSQLFPTSAPYCDLNLVPTFDYDLEKAQLLNCVGPYPMAYESCGVNHTVGASPSRVVTLNQGVTEFMLAMGLADKMVGTAYLDDAIWPRYAAAYAKIPVLSGASYPDEATIMAAKPDFILGSYKSAFRELSCTDKCRGIFNASTGPCAGARSDYFPAGSNATSSYSTCRPQLHAAGIGTWLESVSCEDSALKPAGGATEETAYAAIRQIGAIFNVQSAAEQLVSEMRNDFAIAEQTVKGLPRKLNAVWLDCVDCCKDEGPNMLFVGAGDGAPNLIMQEAGLSNVFATASGSWSCVNESTVLAANPDVMIVVDASWDTAITKIEHLHNHTLFCAAPFVQHASYITIPFSASTLGPRNGAATLDMVSAALHVTTGSAMMNFESGVSFLSPALLEGKTAALRCPVKLQDVVYSNVSAVAPVAPSPPASAGGDAAGGAGNGTGGDGGAAVTTGPADGDNSGASGSSSDSNDGLTIGLVIAAVAAVGALLFVGFMVSRERAGKALFKPLDGNDGGEARFG